jgi:hypothetical protein
MASAACGSTQTPIDASADADCKHEIVDKTSTAMIDGMTWCAYAQTYDAVCGDHIAVADCRKSCNDPNVTRCSLPGQVGPIMKLADGGPACAGQMGMFALTCETTHTVGTMICQC